MALFRAPKNQKAYEAAKQKVGPILNGMILDGIRPDYAAHILKQAVDDFMFETEPEEKP